MTELQLEKALQQITKSCHRSGWSEENREKYDRLYCELRDLRESRRKYREQS